MTYVIEKPEKIRFENGHWLDHEDNCPTFNSLANAIREAFEECNNKSDYIVVNTWAYEVEVIVYDLEGEEHITYLEMSEEIKGLLSAIHHKFPKITQTEMKIVNNTIEFVDYI